jgi:DNA-binding transcriptional LysR family regulator
MMADIEGKLARVDLNLLISLSVLLQERNVSRAAERLYLSQSAMSRTLQRLRDVFDDQLFHRSAKGITPTSKAQELEQQLPELLFQLDHILDPEKFSPETCTQSFDISVPPLMSHALILPFMKSVNQQAPNICISEYPANIHPHELLATGKLDFAIHVEKSFDKDYQSTSIGMVIPTIYARKDHPILSTKTNRLKECFKYNFAELTVENDQSLQFKHPIELLLAKKGITRKTTVRSNQLSILLQLLKEQDLLLIAPDLLGLSEDISRKLSPVYQFDKSPADAVEFYLISHKRVENSAAHQWIKQQLMNAIKSKKIPLSDT